MINGQERVVLRSTKDDGYKITTASDSVLKWYVSHAIKEDIIKNMDRLAAGWLDELRWTIALAEAGDLINLSRLSPVSDSANTI